jgi:Trk-type K+ transport system membrane component
LWGAHQALGDKMPLLRLAHATMVRHLSSRILGHHHCDRHLKNFQGVLKEEQIMRGKALALFVLVFFCIGVLGLLRFSQNARTVDATGLFASSFACGAAVVGLVTALSGKSKT